MTRVNFNRYRSIELNCQEANSLSQLEVLSFDAIIRDVSALRVRHGKVTRNSFFHNLDPVFTRWQIRNRVLAVVYVNNNNLFNIASGIFDSGNTDLQIRVLWGIRYRSFNGSLLALRSDIPKLVFFIGLNLHLPTIGLCVSACWCNYKGVSPLGNARCRDFTVRIHGYGRRASIGINEFNLLNRARLHSSRQRTRLRSLDPGSSQPRRGRTT